MRKKFIRERYRELISNIEGIPDSNIDPFADELYRRHSRGWAVPSSTYARCKHILYYKESLDRPSPYYIDLLKIEDRDALKVVLKDLYNTIKVKYTSY